MNNIKIYLADDHQLLIDGIASILNEQSGITIIGTANDGKKVLQDMCKLEPDLLLLDLNMPRLDGLKVIEAIKENYPKVKILVLSNYNATHIIKEVQQKGADGYLLKNGSISELITAIHAIYVGETFFRVIEAEDSCEDNNYFLDEFMKEYQLTKREKDIIMLLIEGKSSKEIGEDLFISIATVDTHRKNILKKLGLQRTSEVMAMAVRNGWVGV